MTLTFENLGWGLKGESKNPRTITYIDGFNLYFGLKSSKLARYYWLDLRSLSQNLLVGDSELVGVKYFTSRIAGPEEKRKRQVAYIEAIQTLERVELYFGKFSKQPYLCPLCDGRSDVPSEKMTDVNIATQMLRDAFEDRYDTAVLISADSDLSAPVRTIREMFPGKRVEIAFPPNRNSRELTILANSTVTISLTMLKESQLPEEIVKPSGYVIRRPPEWSA